MRMLIFIIIFCLASVSCSKNFKPGSCFLDKNDGASFFGKIIDSTESECTFQIQNTAKGGDKYSIEKQKGDVHIYRVACKDLGILDAFKVQAIKVVDCPQ